MSTLSLLYCVFKMHLIIAHSVLIEILILINCVCCLPDAPVISPVPGNALQDTPDAVLSTSTPRQPTQVAAPDDQPPAAANSPAVDLPPAARVDGDAQYSASVGMFGSIKQVFLPGTELIADPAIGPNAGFIVVRIDGVYPHGDGFRYDLTWSVEKPGRFNLSQSLRRRDGTSADNLPTIFVDAVSSLAPDRFTPNPLRPLAGGWIGGYRVLLGLLAFFWLAGLFAFYWFRPKPPAPAVPENTAQSRLQQIREQLEAIIRSEILATSDKARLELLIVAFWREQRQLAHLTPEALHQALRSDSDSGPLLLQLERWLYDRPQRTDAAELADLLQPLQRMVDRVSVAAERISG